MEQIPFQIEAVDKLVANIKRLWGHGDRQIPVVLKAPTGSGKTYMTQKMICEMAEQPDWDRDVAYVWITFSDDLAMQSKHKFEVYFPTSKHGRLLTIEDFSLGALQKNDVLFINWQKLVSEKAGNRIYRRPENPDERHESRVYFEDFVENTHANGVEIVFIIDECHLNVTEAANRDVISKLDPKICIHVSATPPPEVMAKAADYDSNVVIKHEDVVAQGLIKESIVTQTKENLDKYKGEDEDHALLKLAIEKRRELKAEIEAFGKNVNPLVIIQLPNDDETLKEQGQPTKEEITKEYLISQGVKANRIASWFTGKAKPEGLERNDSEYEYLLFKTAAGTGWDCPRAQVLVMFRDIKSEIFSTQTIGRILRVPIMHEEVSKVFRNGYLYTNFSRKAVTEADYGGMGNKPKTLISYNKKGEDYIIDPNLKTDMLSRVDYGDLGKSGEFQQCLFDTFNRYFGITDEDVFDDVVKRKLETKGLNLKGNLAHEIVSDAQFYDYENIGINLKEAKGVEREWSRSDVQKLFTFTLVEILRSQSDNDCKVGNIVRSVPTLKSALRLWFKYYALKNEDEDKWYRIFLHDALNGSASSIFRRLITETLKAYHPLLEEQLRKRREENRKRQSVPFVLKKMYSYTEEHDDLTEQKCLLHPFFLGQDYTGRKTEESFYKYLESQDGIEWWFKNGDSGKDWLAIRYFSEERNEEALFYPDWVFKKKDGTIGIFDTKGGQTAASKDTKNKAEALQKRLAMLNRLAEGRIKYVGGIVIAANGTWYYNDNEEYAYQPGSTDGWKMMQDMFDVLMDGGSLNAAILHSISPSDRFTRFLPLYSIQAACGYFDEYEKPETEGWVDVSSLPFTPNREMFVVHAKGNSMLPKIKDGDLCVFERYHGGSREGEIVLSQVNEYYEEYGGKYTIKKFHSEKTVNEEGVEVHSKIELQPLNKDGFQAIEIPEDNEAKIATIGVLKYIIC